jgi:sorbitol-specific phosphotransferase system component IIBC
MFVAGLIVGPAVGLLTADFLCRNFVLGTRWGVRVIALVCLALLVAPVLNEGLRIGLVFGIVVGALLDFTPEETPVPAQEQ